MRGLLCQKCNMALGLLNDSRTLMRQAELYLRKHHTVDGYRQRIGRGKQNHMEDEDDDE